MGNHRTILSLSRFVATRHKHRHHHRYLSHGVSHPGHPDTLALQTKLSELILALEGARNELAAVEKQPEGTLENIAEEMRERAGVSDERPRNALQRN